MGKFSVSLNFVSHLSRGVELAIVQLPWTGERDDLEMVGKNSAIRRKTMGKTTQTITRGIVQLQVRMMMDNVTKIVV